MTNAITPAANQTADFVNPGRAPNQTSERDLFMTLLVAQLKNQDPLAPQEGAEFVAQLAQFNSLDQLIGIRHSIEQLTYEIQRGRDETPPAAEQTT